MDPQDRFEIQDLYALYGHTMDAGDFAGWAGLFTEDGVWDRVEEPGGEPLFAVTGRRALIEFAREDYAGRGSGMGRHWMGNLVIEGEPPLARGRCYGFLIQLIDGRLEWLAHGNFYDDLVKIEGEGWRFGRRSVVLLNEPDIPSEG
jgi:hypothetical protein